MEYEIINGIRVYDGDIAPDRDVVFVFGSNPEGRHGAGAAKTARELFGAVYGQGEGLQGNAYALPTKDLRVSENKGLRSISPGDITKSIQKLYDTARQNPDRTFCIAYRNTTKASLNGYTGLEMMRMFDAAGPLPGNIAISKEWSETEIIHATEGRKEACNLAPNGKPSNLPPGLYEAVRRPEFISLHGDWTNGQSDLLLDVNGEPKILWHGSTREFDSFDFSHSGENTGITEYTDRRTGEKVTSDSERAMFFSDSRTQAIAYGFLGWTNRLSSMKSDLSDAIETLATMRGNAEKTVALFGRLKEDHPDLRDTLGRIDFSRPRPISSLNEEERNGIREALIARRDGVDGKYRHGFSGSVGSPITNQFNNISRQQEYFGYFRRNFGRVRANDMSMPTECLGGKFSTFERSTLHFFDGRDSLQSGASVFEEDGRLVICGQSVGRVFADTLTDGQSEALLSEIEKGLDACAEGFNRTVTETGYRENTHLYPAFLRMGKPLVHDYKGSAFPDKYIPNEQYDTAYVAARQNAKAHREGYDGVVYENITDPFLSTTYGVFSGSQIVQVDRSLLKKEAMDVRLCRCSDIPYGEDNIYVRQDKAAAGEREAYLERVQRHIDKGVIASAGELRYGWSLVRHTSGKCNFSDKDGRLMTKDWFDSATEFRSARAIIERNGVKAEINENGRVMKVFEQEESQRQGSSMKR